MIAYGDVLYDEVLQPVTGRALPVRAGQTLHLTLIEGPQCVDFNCFNLHDYREHMSVGHMRRTGFRAHRGSIIWSKPPRYNPMMVILEKPDTCVTDLLGARCHAAQFEKERGYPGTHTNCQDTLAEAIAEYGLTPDDVHDSLNFWMNTGWEDNGTYIPNVRRNTGRKGDQVVLLALMDVLAVPNVCGSGDVSNTSNFWFRPIRITVRDATGETRLVVDDLRQKHTGFRNQRTPDQFKVKHKQEDRACRRDPHYKPEYVNFPLKIHNVEVELTEADLANVNRLVKRGYGDDVEDAVRSAVMTWYTRHRTPQIVPECLDIEM
jgi:uncharacterized protein YcgI (DUF1989 family)